MLQFTVWTWDHFRVKEHDFIRVWKSETGKEWQIGIGIENENLEWVKERTVNFAK